MKHDIEFYQKHMVINYPFNKKVVIYYSEIQKLTYTVKNIKNYLLLFFIHGYDLSRIPGALYIELYEIIPTYGCDNCYGVYMDYERLSELPPKLKERLIVNE